MRSFACRVCERERDRVTSQHISYLVAAFVCVCVSVRERERDNVSSQQSVQPSEIDLIAACVQTHMSIITVSVTQICSPLGLELMVKLRTLLTVFTLILKAEARDYGKGRYISDAACVFGQSQCTGSAGQSEPTALVWRRDFVENEAFERGGA